MMKVSGLSAKRPAVLKIPNKEVKCETLTQKVFRAVCVVVIVIREMVDSETAALIDTCKTKTTRKMHVMFRRVRPTNRMKNIGMDCRLRQAEVKMDLFNAGG